jgi:chorismate mutase
MLRGIRGAIVARENTKDAILEATRELLSKMIQENNIEREDIASIFFSVTKDLDAEFPAFAARNLGFEYTPLLCLNEIPVPGSLEKCIRILIHVNTDIEQKDLKHIYIGGAKNLRTDLKEG